MCDDDERVVTLVNLADDDCGMYFDDGTDPYRTVVDSATVLKPWTSAARSVCNSDSVLLIALFTLVFSYNYGSR